MRHLTKLASKLYPRWWRERYGDEFAALLEDAKPGFRGTLDILKGALAMQLSTSSALKAIFACAVIGVVAGIVTTYFVTPQYSSRAVLRLSTPEGGTTQDAAATISGYSKTILSRANLSNLIRALGLYQDEITKMPSEDVLELMRSNIRITPGTVAVRGNREAPAFEIEFQYPDPAAATNVVTVLATRYLEQNLDANGELEKVRMEMLDPASQPTDPVFPHLKNFAVAGLGTGLLLGSFAALILHLRRKRQPA